MKKKEKYEAPQTEVTKVELENGFMAGSVVDKEDNKDNPVDAGDQEVGGNYELIGNEWQTNSEF